MMAARGSEERPLRHVPCQSKAKDGSSLATSPGPEEEPFSWPGPKTLRLRRTSQGFGFTLRHFIVYPPESAVHNSIKDEEKGSRGRQRSRLEPMDTIFVKQVKDGGPAHGAGLCTGDRIVKVNSESIIGKTYSQVIALIQNSNASLELCVMPKDEDILQLAYSQDAYLKGNAAYSGNAHDIPQPPPICYPRIETKAADPGEGDAPREPAPTEKVHRVEIPLSIRKDTSPARAKTEDKRYRSPAETGPPQTQARPPASSPSRRPPPGTRAGPKRPEDFPSPKAEQPSPHQNIDWKNYTTYKDYIDAKRLHAYGCRTIQERLDSLRAAAAADSGSAYARRRAPSPCGAQRGPAASQVRWRSVSTDRGVNGGSRAPPLRSASQERLGGSERSENWPRSASQDALGVSAGVGAPPPDLPSRPEEEERLLLCQGEEARASRQGSGHRAAPHLRRDADRQANSPLADGTCGKPPWRGDGDVPRPSRLPVKNAAPEPRAAAAKAADQRSHGAGNHAGYTSPPRSDLRTRADSLKMESRNEVGPVGRSSSCSGAPCKISSQRLVTSGAVANGAVVQKPKSSVRARPPSCIFSVCDKRGTSPPLVKAGSADAVACWSDGRGMAHLRRPGGPRHKCTSEHLRDSLDSIPFIDEPSSPSTDLDVIHIPASAVISATPLITTVPPSPTATSPLMRRHMSHDHESLRLTVIESDSGGKTERSLSYDEGLDTYREDGGGRSLTAGFKGLRKATADRSSDDSGSRRDSSSDVFCDAAREGLLHFKQLNTDKGKRAGGGTRAWKPVYGVLRGHYLCLYKDKKDGRSHANCRTSDEPLAVGVRACLVDISYSDTKRKNVLRLTTCDREYLLQAEDREDMLAWIRVIQESARLDEENAAFTSHDLISQKIREYNTLMSPTGGKTEPSPRSSRQSLSIRHTLLGGSKTPSPNSPRAVEDASPPKDKGTWRKGIPNLMRKPFERRSAHGVTFGVRLDDCPPARGNKFVPLIVEVCCQLVEERGLEYTGIYRVPGNNAAISSMQDELNNKGVNDIDVQDDKWRDLNVISSLLKSFFRKLPEPLFTNDGYADFIQANRIEDPVERLKSLKTLLGQLPDHHYQTLKFLSAHLKTVAGQSEKNKMEPRNLAIVFGPTLVRTTEDNMTHMVTHMPDQYKIVETLIQNYDWFFTEEGNCDPVTLSHDESAVESQPVPNIDHLLTNIGRTGTPQGEVSDSPTSDSAKSKVSGKDPCGRELLVSSIFAAAGRKRKKSKEKVQPSSSDDDLDALCPDEETPGRRENGARSATASDAQPSSGKARAGEADVSSVASDYSAASSVTFPTGGGEEADDERSERRPAETDSESDFPVFGARLFPARQTAERDAPPRRRSPRSKTDSESSAEAAGGERRAEASARLARVLEVMKKGRSTGSLSSSSRSESERSEPAAWRLKIGERLKFRLRSSSDDALPPEGRRRNNVRRRHTVGGQRDFAQLAAVHDWREREGAERTAESRRRRASRDFDIRDWLGLGPSPSPSPPKAVPEDGGDAAPANGRSKAAPGDDAHPHKLSGAQVVRSRFYQYL
ncbi:rho GTPase-activating protein 21-B-like isoform X2 [Stigmatopora argus]